MRVNYEAGLRLGSLRCKLAVVRALNAAGFADAARLARDLVVDRWLSEREIATGQPPWPRRDKELRRLVACGLTTAEIAQEMHLRTSYVQDRIIELNLVPKRRASIADSPAIGSRIRSLSRSGATS